MINSYIIYRKRMFAFLCGIGIPSTALLIVVIGATHSPVWVLLCVFILFLPLLLIKAVLRVFTRKVYIDFGQDSFSVEAKKLDGKEDTGLVEYNLANLRSYVIKFPNRRFAAIELKSRINESVEFSFPQEKRDSQQYDTNELLNRFHGFFKEYNRSHDAAQHIALQPSFYATKTGLWVIVGLSLFFTIAVVFHAIYDIKTSFLSLFCSLSLIVQVIIKRRSDLEYYKKMRDN